MPGYKVGPLGIILIILGVAGIVGSTLREIRFRALVESIVGGTSLILTLVSNAVVHHVISNQIGQLIGGISGISSVAGSNPHIAKLSNLIANPSWGFYICVVSSLALGALGIRSVFLYKSSPLVPDNISSLWSSPQLQQIRETAKETAVTAFGQVKQVDLRSTKLGIIRNRKIVYSLGGAVGIVAVYLISMSIYNSTHSLNNTVKSFIRNTSSDDSGRVGKLISTKNPIEPAVLIAFVGYYAKHQNALKQLLLPLENPIHQSSLQQLLSPHSGAKLVKHDILGFTSYRIALPTPKIKLTIPKNTTVTIGGKKVANNLYTLPAVYSLKLTTHTPFGPVSTNTQEDTTGGSVQADMAFPQDQLQVTSPDISGTAKLTINGD